MNKLTMSDIAKLAGVSRVTVSRYINGGYVAAEKKERISQIIEENSFRPNMYAQSLKRELSIIGVAIPTVISRTSNLLLKGIIDGAHNHGYQTLFNSYEFNDDLKYQIMQDFDNLKVKGCITLLTDLDDKIDRYKLLNNCVIITRKAHSDIKCLVYQDRASVKALYEEVVLAIKHAIKKVVGVVPRDILSIRGAAIKEFAEKNDFAYQNISMQNTAESDPNVIIEKGSMYICATDQIAINIYKAADMQNYIVGKDIFVAGFGNYSISSQLKPSLTSVDHLYYDAGVKSVEMLLGDEKKTEYVDFKIYSRKSTSIS